MGKLDITAIPLSTITAGLEGKIIGIYGTNNVGKSYVAAHLYPNQTLWCATERGYNAQAGLRPYDVETWGDFRDVVAQLTTRNEKKAKVVREMYKCVVVDVADKLPDLATAYVISRYNEKNRDKDDFVPITEVGDIPYGGGYASVRKEIDGQITKLSLAGYCLVLIFHEEIRKPLGSNKKEDEYIVPKNTMTKSGNVLKDTPDFMIYVEPQGIDENGKPILSMGHCVQHKEFFARSRYTQCPEIINPFTADNLRETVKIACEREANIQNVTPITLEQEQKDRKKKEESNTLTLEEAIERVKPLFMAICKAGQVGYAQSVVTQYLGDGKKVTQAEPQDIAALGFIYNDFIDFAENKGIEWDE